MLKSYEITNFKSFKNPTIIDLTSTSYELLTDRNTKDDILKGLLFVGANASGKSNAVIAVKLLLDLLFGKAEINLGAYQCLFCDDSVIQLRYTFSVNESEIVYAIKFDLEKGCTYEMLWLDGRILLEREGSYARVMIDTPTEYNDLLEGVLFLREIYFNTKFRGNSTLQMWFQELQNSLYYDLYEHKGRKYINAEVGLSPYLEMNGTDRMNKFFQKYHFEQSVEYTKEAVGTHFTFSTESDEKYIFFKRHAINAPIPYDMESLGNQNLLRLLPAFFHCLDNNGILLIDEFSSGFHNYLEELLIRYFMQESKGAQLIFVSHSTNLLSTGLLRPDQIYTVDFDDNGSHTNRVSDAKPRPSQDLEQMYLSGRFDGVPDYEN